jgi:hypothetical protein
VGGEGGGDCEGGRPSTETTGDISTEQRAEGS